MRTLLALIKKEFFQIWRNPIMRFLVIGMPIMQLVVLVNAANFDIKNLSLTIIDKDNSTLSTKLTSKIESSGYFVINKYTLSMDEALNDFASDKSDLILEIPSSFEKDVYKGDATRISIVVNAINSMKAGLAGNYITSIIGDFTKEQLVSIKGPGMVAPTISTEQLQWFNSKLDYKSLMLPGILAILITLIGTLLSSLNIVREKEAGTIEQLNVTPITKTQFIIGKLFPIWIIGLFQLSFGLVLSVLIFNLEILGSVALLYGVVAVYLLSVLGIGFLISTTSQSQTQAMLVTLFFAIIFILLSGLFTPTEYMPNWAKAINTLNPTAYLVEIIRLVVLKGSQFMDILRPFVAISIFGLVINLIVIWRYRKVS